MGSCWVSAARGVGEVTSAALDVIIGTGDFDVSLYRQRFDFGEEVPGSALAECHLCGRVCLYRWSMRSGYSWTMRCSYPLCAGFVDIPPRTIR